MTDAFCDIETEASFLRDNVARVPKKFQEAANSLLLAYYQRRNKFSDKQANFLKSIANMLKDKPTPKTVSVGDMKGVVQLFDNAKKTGLKNPKIRLQHNGGKVVISIAGPNARFPGTINVTDGGPFGESKFYGRVSLDGAFEEREHNPGLNEFLRELSIKPKETAKAHGKLTGQCCLCGRKLTDPVSVANGIGPICEAGWL